MRGRVLGPWKSGRKITWCFGKEYLVPWKKSTRPLELDQMPDPGGKIARSLVVTEWREEVQVPFESSTKSALLGKGPGKYF